MNGSINQVFQEGLNRRWNRWFRFLTKKQIWMHNNFLSFFCRAFFGFWLKLSDFIISSFSSADNLFKFSFPLSDMLLFQTKIGINYSCPTIFNTSLITKNYITVTNLTIFFCQLIFIIGQWLYDIALLWRLINFNNGVNCLNKS